MKFLLLLLPLLCGCVVVPKFEAGYNPETKEWNIVRQWEEGPFYFKGSADLPDGTRIEVEIDTTIKLDAAQAAHALEQQNIAKALDMANAAMKAGAKIP